MENCHKLQKLPLIFNLQSNIYLVNYITSWMHCCKLEFCFACLSLTLMLLWHSALQQCSCATQHAFVSHQIWGQTTFFFLHKSANFTPSQKHIASRAHHHLAPGPFCSPYVLKYLVQLPFCSPRFLEFWISEIIGK